MRELDRYLTPPDPVDPPKCQLCGEFPGDDYLYEHDGMWMCGECLKDQFQRRDIYMSDWSDLNA